MIRPIVPGEYLDLDEAFVGSTIARIEREADQIAFTLSTGGRLVMYDSQNGSECQIAGDLAVLIDRKILAAIDKLPAPAGSGVSVFLGTDKGSVILQWLTAETIDIVATPVEASASAEEGRG